MNPTGVREAAKRESARRRRSCRQDWREGARIKRLNELLRGLRRELLRIVEDQIRPDARPPPDEHDLRNDSAIGKNLRPLPRGELHNGLEYVAELTDDALRL